MPLFDGPEDFRRFQCGIRQTGQCFTEATRKTISINDSTELYQKLLHELMLSEFFR